MKRYFIDGCFDGFHYGHVNALFQSKKQCDELFAGTHSDDEMTQFKKPSIYSYEIRSKMLQNFRFVDKYVGEAPYVVRNDILDKFGCSKYLHGDEQVLTSSNQNAICVDLDRYATYEVTKGISSTQLRQRIHQKRNQEPVEQNMDIDYLTDIYQDIRTYLLNACVAAKPLNLELRVEWDELTTEHIDYLLDMRMQNPDNNIIIKLDDSNNGIYNKYELAIILLGLKCVDDVIIE